MFNYFVSPCQWHRGVCPEAHVEFTQCFASKAIEQYQFYFALHLQVILEYLTKITVQFCSSNKKNKKATTARHTWAMLSEVNTHIHPDIMENVHVLLRVPLKPCKHESFNIRINTC